MEKNSVKKLCENLLCGDRLRKKTMQKKSLWKKTMQINNSLNGAYELVLKMFEKVIGVDVSGVDEVSGCFNKQEGARDDLSGGS